MTDRNFVLEYIKRLPDTSFDSPFDEDFDSIVMRHKSSKKWFGLIMSVSGSKIGREDSVLLDIMNLKSNPDDSVILFELYPEIIPAYHMNKTHWITVALDGSADSAQIKWLLDLSYDLTNIKSKK